MEYLQTYTLDAFVRSRIALSEEELREIASCCLLGLDSIHNHRVLHGVREQMEVDGIECQTEEHVHHTERSGETG